MVMSRCDLHIHSRFSARSEEWLFRRFDFPDSYSDPHELHRLLREHGMDFVTITDHDTIDGNLEIAELPGTFISEEVTTYFPQDPCKIHVLVWGITEAQHANIVQLRDNIGHKENSSVPAGVDYETWLGVAPFVPLLPVAPWIPPGLTALGLVITVVGAALPL